MGSPSKENMDNNNTMSNGCQSASADTSLDKSPLLQKLNRMHGDSVILVCSQAFNVIHNCRKDDNFKWNLLNKGDTS